MAAADYDFTLTRNQIIGNALRAVGALGPAEIPSGGDMAEAIQLLQAVVKSWQTKRIYLWQETSGVITLSAAAGPYTFSTADPVIYLLAAQRRTSSRDHDLDIISYEDYCRIQEKTRSGTPVKVAVNYIAIPEVYVWPVPTGVDYIYYLGVRKLKDWDTAAGSGDFPEHWQEALTFALAYRLSFPHGLPMSERKVLKDEADRLFKQAADSDRPREDFTVVRGAFD